MSAVYLTPQQRAACIQFAHELTAATRKEPDKAGDMMVFTSECLRRLGQSYKARQFERLGAEYNGEPLGNA